MILGAIESTESANAFETKMICAHRNACISPDDSRFSASNFNVAKIQKAGHLLVLVSFHENSIK